MWSLARLREKSMNELVNVDTAVFIRQGDNRFNVLKLELVFTCGQKDLDEVRRDAIVEREEGEGVTNLLGGAFIVLRRSFRHYSLELLEIQLVSRYSSNEFLQLLLRRALT